MKITNRYGIYLCFLMIFLTTFSDFTVETLRTEEGLELLFRERSPSDWENVWHHETHSRCRDKLVRHLYWACEKDIYRLTRRNQKRIPQPRNKSLYDTWWLLPNEWRRNAFIRTRRTKAFSITNECCTKIGCTWEEYAEYCPTNKRRNHF